MSKYIIAKKGDIILRKDAVEEEVTKEDIIKGHSGMQISQESLTKQEAQCPVIIDIVNHNVYPVLVRLFNKHIIPDGVIVDSFYNGISYQDVCDSFCWKGLSIDRIRLDSDESLKDNPVKMKFSKYNVHGMHIEIPLEFKAGEDQLIFNATELKPLDLTFDGFTSLEFTIKRFLRFYLFPKK